MDIYIPKHIRNIEVVDKMCQLIEGYAQDVRDGIYANNTIDSFNNYYYYLKVDPVIRFLHICIPESKWRQEGSDIHKDEDYDSAINYLSRLFYSTKGTYKVFEYMKKYLDLKIKDPIIYTVKTLKIEISEVDLKDIDESVWYEAFVDFLRALIYFDTLDIKIEYINLYLGNKLENYTGAHIVTYKEYTAKEYNTTVSYDN